MAIAELHKEPASVWKCQPGRRGSTTWFSSTVKCYDAHVVQLRRCLDQHGTFYTRNRLGSRSNWLHFHPNEEASIPAAFWKIHLAVHPERMGRLFELLELFGRTVPVGFKLPLSLHGYLFLHNPPVPELLFGKTVTFYPTSEEELRHAVDCIEEHWSDDSSPKILGDLYCRENSSIGIRWGEYSAKTVALDPVGRAHRFIPLRDGILGRDLRSPTDAHKQPTTPIELCGRQWCPLDLLASRIAEERFCNYKMIGATGTWFNGTLTARGPDDSLSCIKFVHHCGMIGMDGLTAAERSLSHLDVAEKLQKAGLLPAGEVSCRHSNHFSFIQYPWVEGSTIEGSLDRLSLHQLIKIGRSISRLHDAGFIHRDIKPSNIVASDSGSEFTCIDFDLAVLEGAVSSDLGGSVGYRPPEYLSSEILTRSYDTFSFSTLVVQALSGHAPTDAMDSNLIKALLDVNGWGPLASSVLQARHFNPARRSSIPSLCRALARAYPRIRKHRSGPSRRFMHEARQAITLGWSIFTRSAAQHGDSQEARGSLPPDISIYSGVAGIVLALESLAPHVPPSEREGYLQHAKAFSYKAADLALPPGFLVGRAGLVISLKTTAPSSTYFRGYDGVSDLLPGSKSCLDFEIEDPSLFFGRAGLLFATALLGTEAMPTRWDSQIRAIAESLIAQARNYDGQVCWVPSGLLDGSQQPTNGLFHGTAGIALGLGCYGALVGEQVMCNIAAAAMEGIFDKLCKRSDIGLPIYVTKPISNPAEHSLSHGLPGFAWSLIRLRHVLKPEVFSQIYCQIVDRLLLAKISGPASWAHGLPGVIDLLIDILSMNLGYRRQDVSSYLEDSVRVLLAMRAHDTQFGPTWSFGPDEPIPFGLCNGLTGTMRVLARWLALCEHHPTWNCRFLDPCQTSSFQAMLI